MGDTPEEGEGATATVTVGLEADEVDGANPTVTVGAGSEQTSPGASSAGLSLRALAQRLVLGEKIAEGGMGVVWTGYQRHLGREVAVKTLRPERATAANVAQLLQEAWVTGQLEHPNIVPIHDIAVDEEDRPQVVLKRVEGKSWRQLLREPSEIPGRVDADDPLEWHIRVVIAVCNALELAHSRDVIHRDIKPANVMIGRYGEVYLLDWGLAVGLSEDPSGRIPTASDASALAGTAAYMAPEQLTGDPRTVSRKTDVYLVGASLFEVVTGRPPFASRKLEEAALSEPSPPPALPSSVPDELAAVIRRAMAPDPEDRPHSIRALRLELEGFLEHRGSRALAARAREREDALEEAIAAGDDEEAERAFAEASFGYRAAVEAWPGNEEAVAALRALTIRRVEDALRRDRPDVAARLLATVDGPPGALRREVDEAQRAREEARARAAALERAHDRGVGKGTRRVLVAVLGTTWAATWAWLAMDPPSPTALAVITAGFLAIALVASALVRRVLVASRPNLGIFWIVVTMLTAMIALFATGPRFGLGPEPLLTVTLLIWALSTAIGAATIDPRFGPAPAIFLIGFLVAAVWPGTLGWAFAGSGAVFILTALVVNALVRAEPEGSGA